MPEVRLPRYVTRDRSASGRVRYYFRREGRPKVRIREEFGSLEFWAAYAAALKNEAGPPASAAPRAARAILPGSFRELVVSYLSALDRDTSYEPRTKYTRRRHLEETCLETVTFGAGTPKQKDFQIGDLPLERVTTPVIQVVLDRRMNTPEAANDKRKCLQALYVWAVPRGHAKTNPIRDSLKIKTFSQGHDTWTIEDVEQFAKAHPMGTKPYLAMALLLFTGQRAGDVIRFGRQHVKDGSLVFVQEKNKKRLHKQMMIPILPQLQAALDTVPAGQLTFIQTEDGTPYSTVTGFGNWFRRHIDKAGLRDEKKLSAHGLRKGLLTLGPKFGVTPFELMAIAGHSSLKETTRYTREYEREQQAKSGMAKLRGLQIGNKTVPGSDT